MPPRIIVFEALRRVRADQHERLKQCVADGDVWPWFRYSNGDILPARERPCWREGIHWHEALGNVTIERLFEDETAQRLVELSTPDLAAWGFELVQADPEPPAKPAPPPRHRKPLGRSKNDQRLEAYEELRAEPGISAEEAYRRIAAREGRAVSTDVIRQGIARGRKRRSALSQH